MRKRASRRIPQILALLTVAALAAAAPAVAMPVGGFAGAAPSAAAAAVDDPLFELCATTGNVTLPNAGSVPIWGFVTKTSADCSAEATHATLPGPLLDIPEGAPVTLSVTNALPAGHRLSLEAPGISFDPGPTEADVGDTVTVTFTAGAPGTYLYQSVGDGERQTAMGLFGALIVRSNTANQAYDTAASAYDVEAPPLVLSAIDPSFNANPDSFDMYGYHATYWLINGKTYPDTDPIHAPGGQQLLLRYVNAGYDNTSMMLLGMHEHVIARDANLLPNAFDADTETIPAGGTEDVIATVPTRPSAMPNGFPLYNRQLNLSNGAPSEQHTPGGMMTFIQSP
jgi:FtsP/CotA-like multicopper oxidase with cupredoxin domain